jgi:hypothetical protein
LSLFQPITNGDAVMIRYTGWLEADSKLGGVFDSNTDKGKPFRMILGAGKVIKGWEQGLLGMKKEGRRVLVIPPSLGYGVNGAPPVIPPNSILIFDVELLKIKRGETSKAATPEPAVVIVSLSVLLLLPSTIHLISLSSGSLTYDFLHVLILIGISISPSLLLQLATESPIWLLE